MSMYVLIHGAWHGAFCWNKVIPLLQRAGHTVVAPDLPGHGDDPMPPAQVTLQAYVDRVCEILDRAEEPVLLVGHSMGGVVVTQVAEERPDKVAKIIYLSAFLPASGQSLMSLAGVDSASRVPSAMIPSEDGASMMLHEEGAREAFYADCSDEDVAKARARLRPQPLAPLMAPVSVTPERYGKSPRFYIRCELDQAVTPGLQRAMLDAVPSTVFTLPTSHSPFYSAPEALAAQLLAIGKG